jgi:hypothetical protein
MLDKSKGLVLGSELVTNGTFASGSTGYVEALNGTVSYANGTMLATGTSGNTGVYQDVTVVSGRAYKISWVISSGTNWRVNFYNGASFTTSLYNNGTGSAASGVYSAVVFPTTTAIRLYLHTGSGTTAEFDNISVKELPGNHAVQATTGARPIYGVHPFGGRRNLLTRTEEFENAGWTKSQCSISANVDTAPDGSATADRLTSAGSFPAVSQGVSASGNVTFTVYAKDDGSGQIVFRLTGSDVGGSGQTQTVYRFTFSTQIFTFISGGTATGFSQAVGNGWYRITLTCGTTTLSGAFLYPRWSDATVVSVLIWGAQLETGSTATAYQRVTDQYNVTEAGVASVSYLFFDGADSMSTSSINFTATDKTNVFGGVRKLNDAAYNVVVDLSADPNTNLGAFNFGTSTVVGDASRRTYSFGVTRPAGVILTGAGVYAAPTTNVFTGVGDISGDRVTLRVNGAQVAQLADDQGSGNFGNFPMFIGARNGSGNFFSGNIYSLIVRGASSSSILTSATEGWVASKTGVVIA